MNKSMCPYFGLCGGCSLSDDYSIQLEKKQCEMVSGILGIESSAKIEEPVSGPSEGYRSRARFRYSAQGMSFYEEQSHNPVVIKHCPILDEKLNNYIANPPKINLWELEDGQLSAISSDKDILRGDQMGWITLSGRRLPVTGNVFFQSNRLLLPAMIDYVCSLVEGPSVMDLYAGVGTFSAFLEDKYSVTAVEINKKCLSLARQHLKNTEFFASPVEKWNPKRKNVNTVIVDPPRVGLDSHVPSMISSWHPSRVVYVSCYLPTLLRDLKRFALEGYRVESARLFDFYPHTSHLETVVCLINQNARAKHHVNVGIDAEEYYKIKDKKN